MTHNSIY